MKVQKLENFKIESSMARQIAEARWGKGGTQSQRTTKKGFYYYSCSGHGGYVIDKKMFSEEEQRILDEVHTSETMRIAVAFDDKTGEEMVFGWANPFVYSSKNVRIPYGLFGAKWTEHEFYLFEEDCDWAIVEQLTGVRRKWIIENHGEEARAEQIKESLKRWNPKAYEALVK